MKKALFLDRDGVINIDHGYVGKFEDFEFVDGIFSVIRQFESKGFVPVIVTNQSGIARGFYSESDFHTLMDNVQREFTQQGIGTVLVYYCPHHIEGQEKKYAIACACRKPLPGMFLQAASDLGIDLQQSVMVGDSWRDILAADSAGINQSFYLSNKHINKEQYKQLSKGHSVTQINNLSEILATF
ncbi:D-glycero-beta-D-manno-heptose 1,7-bisphosphate 7-phosphatase [Alteromonas sp. D210916BOD_24]|uniref:D-glycero-beta-D-manno-heptose 1,7-bisphosphate 7-phosphatase n=1 Tax=Alteromonas sp. D210916BOD_24 TaxID=3157618 RepID=UPI00399D1581